MIRVLIQTDLPEPVAPAISKCGIFPISVTTTWPPISCPPQKRFWMHASETRPPPEYPLSIPCCFLCSAPRCRLPIYPESSLDTDIRGRQTELDIIGQSHDPAHLHALLRMKLIPCHRGPQLMLVTVTPTPKFCSVCCSLMAVSRYSLSENGPEFLPFLRS